MTLPSIDVAALATVIGGAGPAIFFNDQQVDLDNPPDGMSIDQSNGALNITINLGAGSGNAGAGNRTRSASPTDKRGNRAVINQDPGQAPQAQDE